MISYIPGDGQLYATIQTNMGNITIKLFEKEVPKTVGNFVGLATGNKEWTHPQSNQKMNSPLYNGTIFHRVIDGFMVQGGDPLGKGFGGPGYKFEDEFHPSLTHSKGGILSMANEGPNTNGSQFFITQGPTPHLDKKHSVFGEVSEGMDIVNTIAKVKKDGRDKPIQDVVIENIDVFRK